MLAVTQAYEDASVARVRHPYQQFKVAWERTVDASISIFTLDVSELDGNDFLGGVPDVVLDWDKFLYTDESDNVMGLSYDRQQTEPVFSVAKATLSAELDNNSGRYTPGGGSSIDDFIAIRRPVRAFLGFQGVNSVPQVFVGETTETPEVSTNDRSVVLRCRDFLDRIWNFPLEQSVIFEDIRSDDLLVELLALFGITEDQTDFQQGLNVIAFAYFKKGDKLGPIIQKICEAELAWFYLDESGILKFENRTGWLLRDTVVLDITDDMVISEKTPTTQHIINVVEVTSHPRVVRDEQQLFSLDSYQELPTGGDTAFFVDYDDPVTSVTTPTDGGATSNFVVNEASDGSGADRTGDVSLAIDNFAQSSKITITNNTGTLLYLIQLDVWGTPAKVVGKDGSGIYLRDQDDDSVDDFEEQVVKIDNDFIQTVEQAQTIATMLIEDRKTLSSYKELEIQGQPYLQIGDLVTRGGQEYNVQRIVTTLNQSEGLVQNLHLVNRTIREYFLLDISVLDGPAVLLP